MASAPFSGTCRNNCNFVTGSTFPRPLLLFWRSSEYSRSKLPNGAFPWKGSDVKDEENSFANFESTVTLSIFSSPTRPLSEFIENDSTKTGFPAASSILFDLSMTHLITQDGIKIQVVGIITVVEYKLLFGWSRTLLLWAYLRFKLHWVSRFSFA